MEFKPTDLGFSGASEALVWLVAMGADEITLDQPIDRFAESAKVAPPAPAKVAPTAAPQPISVPHSADASGLNSIAEIIQAIQILTHSPQIGRPARDGKRELVIGRDSRGYMALYRYIANIDTVFILAIRAHREQGYKRQDDP